MNDTVIPCNYYPALPARWFCESCERNFSAVCIKEAPDLHHQENKCPICQNKVKSLGIGNTIRPFWELLPNFFGYPLKTDALIYLIGFSLLNIVAAFNFLFAFFSSSVSIYLILQYSFKCLNHTARGNLEPPGSWDNYESVAKNVVTKQMLVFIILAFFVFKFTSILGGIPGILFLLFILIGIPASTMLLAISGSVLTAVNPLKIFSTMLMIGKSYFALYLLLLFMYANQQFVQNVAAQYVSEIVLIPTLVFIQGFFIIAMYAMMGYIIYQFHEELGFNEVKEFNDDSHTSVKGVSDDDFINEINILIIEAMPAEVIKRLQKKLQRENKLVYFEKFHKILQITNRVKEFLPEEERYIKAILNDESRSPIKRYLAALPVYQACLDADRDYYIDDVSVVFNLGETAYNNAKYDLVIDIFRGFHKRFQMSSYLPKAYFLVAKVLLDYKQNDRQAKQVLAFILKEYPMHELIPEIKEHLQLITKLSG